MKTMMLYVTAASEDEAKKIAHILLQERLVACVNIVPTIHSLYWWEDKIHEDSEVVFIAKTTEKHTEHVINRIKSLHSYECPCITAIPIENGNIDFLDWIAKETTV